MKSTERKKTMKIARCVLALVVLIGPVKIFAATTAQGSEQYQYDAQGRLTRVTYADGSSISYTYDKNGNLLSIAVARLQAKESLPAPTVIIADDEQMLSRANATAQPDRAPENTRTYTIVTKPAHGTASVVDNQLVYTPKAGFHGSDSFTFQAIDRSGVSVDGIAEVTVKAGKGEPPAIQDAAPKAKDTPSASPSGKRHERRH